MIVSLFIRLYYFIGINLSDSYTYLRIIYELEENFQIKDLSGLFGSRIMMIIPPFLLTKIFGVNIMLLVSQSMVCSLLLIPLVYKLSRLYYDTETSLLAAFLISLIPFNIIWASWLMPDVPLEFYMTLSAFFLLKGFKHEDRLSSYSLISGFFTGIAYLTKVTGAFFILVVIAFGVYNYFVKRKVEWRLSFFFIGFLVIFLLQMGAYIYSGIDLVKNYSNIQDYYEVRANRGHLFYYPLILFSIDPETNTLNIDRYFGDFGFIRAPLYGLFGYVIVLSLLYLIYKRDTSTIPLLIWLFVLALYLNFGIQSLKTFKIIHRDARFLSILMPVAIIIMSRFLITVYRSSRNGRYLTAIIFIFLIVSSLYVTHRLWLFDITRTYGMQLAFDFIKEKNGVIYTSMMARQWIETYSGKEHNLTFKGIKKLNCNKVSNAYVLVDNLRPPKTKNVISRKKCLKNSPSDWEKVFDSTKQSSVITNDLKVKKNLILRRSVIYYVP